MNPPQVYMCSHPEPSSLLPSHTILLGCPSAPAPSIQYHRRHGFDQFLGQKDALEEEIFILSNILSWIVPWREETSRLQSMGS